MRNQGGIDRWLFCGLTVVLLTAVAACGDGTPSEPSDRSSPGENLESSASTLTSTETTSVDSDFQLQDCEKPACRAFRSLLTESSGNARLQQRRWGFDAPHGTPQADITNLGRVHLHKDGQIEFGPIPTHHGESGEPVHADWDYQTGFAGIAGNDNSEIEELAFHSSDDRVLYEYSQSDVAVLYEHKPGGLKQYVYVGEESVQPEQTVLKWTLPSHWNVVANYRDEVVLEHGDSGIRIRWAGMRAFDESGAELGAQFRATEGNLAYEIESPSKGAIVVDPLTTNATWTVEGQQDLTALGREVVEIGDINADSYPDLYVGQRGYKVGGADFAGRALIYPGSSNGLSSTTIWSTTGSQNSEQHGIVAAAGDFNDDGNKDIVVGANQWSTTGGKELGRAKVYLGSSSGAPSTSATQTIDGSDDSGKFAELMDSGDFNCDGIPDLAVSEKFYDGTAGTDTGRVYVYDGQSSGDPLDTSAWTYEGPSGGATLKPVANAGDINDDGCDDLIVGLPGSDEAHAFYGNSSGLPSSPDWTKSYSQTASFGDEVQGIGDVNGDGIDDIVVGAPLDDQAANDAGLAHVYHGSGSGPSTSPDWTAQGTKQARFGADVGSQDFNGDGFFDLAVGAWRASKDVSNLNQQGAVYVYLGRSSQGLTTSNKWKNFGEEGGSRFGISVAGIGDTSSTSQNKADLAVGATLQSGAGGSRAGKAYLYDGVDTCLINGTVYSDGTSNPNNDCEVCDTSNSKTSWTTKSDGTSCDDGDACTKNTTCQSGSCQGTQVDCDDGLSCTQDTCDPSSGCENTIASGCLINGTCYADGDKNPNTQCEECDPSQSETSWSTSSQGTSCDDGEFCTVNDTCDSSGNCTSGTSRDCKAELSDAVVACNNTFSCIESADTCSASDKEPDGTSCDDGNACTSNTTCQGGVCKAGTTVSCGTCEKCDPATGNCVMKSDGESCDTDSDKCTLEVCQSGSCQMDSTVSCDPCIECDPSTGNCSMTKSAGAQCGEAMCDQDGNLVQAPTCDGSGNCQNPSTMDCGAYSCVNPNNASAECPEACMADEDCKSGNFCFDRPDDGDGDKECYDNRPPEADAGMDQSRIPPGSRVNLNGSNSSDPDGDDINFDWSLADSTCPGSETSDTEDHRSDLQSDEDWDPTAESPIFTMPQQDCPDEVLRFELVVNDGEFDSEPDRVDISYGNCENPPSADIARSETTEPQWGETLTFDGSGSMTGCGSELNFSWSYEAQTSMPSPPTLDEPAGSNDETYELRLPDTCRESTTRYEIQLQVNDGVQTSPVETYPLVIPPNGPCEGDGGGDVGPGDAGADVGGGDLSGSSCACSAGTDGAPRLPVSVLGVLLVGGLVRLRRKWS